MWKSHILTTVLVTLACGHLACSPLPSSSEVAEAHPPEISSFQLIDEEVTDTIAQQMKLKCSTLFDGNKREKESCDSASSKLAQFLDFNYIKRSDGQGTFVFMSRRLKELLNDRAAVDFLAKLQLASEDALYLNKHFNLWEFAKENSAGREDVAAERLAVLIQDGADTAAQIKYLLIAQHPQALQLAQALNSLEEALKQGKASAYPSDIKLNRTALYHYYVPRYLAQKLRASGTNADMAARLPFLFNSSYELHQIQKTENPGLPLNHRPVVLTSSDDPKMRKLIDKWNAYDTLYSDLLDHLGAPLIPFNPKNQQDNLEDLYLGYAGGLQGAFSNSHASSKRLAFEEFVFKFSENPTQFVKSNNPK